MTSKTITDLEDSLIFRQVADADKTNVFLDDPPFAINKADIIAKRNNEEWDAFMVKLKETNAFSPAQESKLKEFWIKGGSPEINILPKGSEGYGGNINRAFYTRPKFSRPKGTGAYNPEDFLVRAKVNIFEHQLLDNFMAEVSHGLQYGRKEGESIGDWRRRVKQKGSRANLENKQFGRDRYGIKDFGEIFIPISEDDLRVGHTVFPDKEGPVWPHTVYGEEFDPNTRLGVQGTPLTLELEAHEVIEDSLWNVLGKVINKYTELK